MGPRGGAILSIVTCLAFVIVLAWPYVPESSWDINMYYSSGIFFINPLLAGALAIGAIGMFIATRVNYVSAEVGAGIILGLGLFIFLVVLAWAVTARVDIFRAPGWFFPAHRWLLLGLSVLIGISTGWYTWVSGLLPVAGERSQEDNVR